MFPGADPRRRWTVAIFGFVFLTGVSLQVRGTLLPDFAVAFGVGEAELGLVTSAFTLGFMAVLLAVGLSLGRVDARRIFLVGLALTGAFLFLMGRAPAFVALLGFALGRGLGTGLVRGVDRPVLSHLYPASRGRIVTLQTMAWAAGATLGPLAATVALALGDWRLVYAGLAVAYLPLLVLVWRTPPPPGIENEVSLSADALRRLLRRPTVVGMCAALVLSGGVESLFFTWLPYYATGFVSRGVANASLSAFLLGYLPGRFVYSRLFGRVRHTDLALAIAALGVVVTTFAFTVRSPPRLLVGVFAAGVLVSGLFPVVISWGLDEVPEHSGPVNAIGSFSTQIGFLVFPAAVGLLAERHGIVAAMDVVPALMAAYLGVCVVNRLVDRRSTARPASG